jgi:hypothetical protein
MQGGSAVRRPLLPCGLPANRPRRSEAGERRNSSVSRSIRANFCGCVRLSVPPCGVRSGHARLGSFPRCQSKITYPRSQDPARDIANMPTPSTTNLALEPNVFSGARRGLRKWALLVLLVGAATACSSDPRPPAYRADPSDKGRTPVEPEVACSKPEEGCPCDTVGEVVECGTVFNRSADYVTCSPGHITCGDDAIWGACVGEEVVVTE